MKLLEGLPDSPQRAQRELALQIALGAQLTAAKGWAAPEVGLAYRRAQMLCQQVGDRSQLFRVLYGLWLFYEMGGALQTSREVADELMRLAPDLSGPAPLMEAHRSQGGTLFWLGELSAARTHLTQGIALYDPHHHRPQALQSGHDPRVACLSHLARALWPLGSRLEALKKNDEALTLGFVRE